MTWALPRSGVLVGVGVFMSLVLPVAVRLWRASDGVTGWARVERAAVMSFICGGAALYTLVHVTLLLHEEGLPWLIAWVPGAVMEALVVMAARAAAPAAKPVVQRDAQPIERALSRAAQVGCAEDEAPAARDTAPTEPAAPAVTSPAAEPAAPSVADVVEETPEARRRRLARERQQRARARKRAQNTQMPATAAA
ncbi:hypothetical protein [Pseudonocardia asaccharolytica]|uniref:Uncharacterized protein n=1 Tax=Pseudonocardia asaccharolytica DSM 44247 = NBRC 16224 TaxID=1123024 RepID=A0A511D3G9_9PSEU|nr:hypothetical protein [Pseudonocardia asaccharolytica]GEL19336.1 hypothetical protein PA7_31730 [Pseudonocardia asaccharolytica DSM 44247 = NBRC 16224]